VRKKIKKPFNNYKTARERWLGSFIKSNWHYICLCRHDILNLGGWRHEFNAGR